MKFIKLLLLAYLASVPTNLTPGIWDSFKNKLNETTNNIKNKFGQSQPAQEAQPSSNQPSFSDALNKGMQNIKMPGAAQLIPSQLVHQMDHVVIPRLNENNPYRKTPAEIRIGTNLPAEEQQVIAKRLQFTQPALEKFLEQKIPNNKNLRIAFCGSGGGYRAMLSTVGFLIGANQIGLLDTALYMSALSGSTWALGPWTTMNMPIEGFKEQLIPKTQRTINIAGKEMLPPPTPQQFKQVMRNLEIKYLFREPLSSVDLWGAIIANRVFEQWDNRQNLYLSNQKDVIYDGRHIFPIYTAVNPRGDLTYNWFEFTPYEIGSADLRAFTPTWAFGRKFINGRTPGVMTDAGNEFAPEQTLGYYLGICGSAFTVNLAELLDMMNQSEATSDEDYESMQLKVAVAENLASNLMGIQNFRNTRLSPAKVLNYTYGMNQGPLTGEEDITLVDAGLAFNVPTPPLLRPERQINVIFIFDSSADVGMAGELRKAENYARANNLPFPAIDYSKAKTQSLSVFRDENNPAIPTIMYMPLIKDVTLPQIKENNMYMNFDPKACIENGFCSTFNFKYDPQEFETLVGLTANSMIGNMGKIQATFRSMLGL